MSEASLSVAPLEDTATPHAVAPAQAAPAARASLLARATDPLIALSLFALYLGALLATSHGLGYARDEGFYFHAAGTYGKWFELLGSKPARALTPAIVDRFWQENHEHPALMKSLFWLSHKLFAGWLLTPGTAMRLPAMLVSSAGVATTFAFGRRCIGPGWIGRSGGVVAALGFALMPQVFHHSHLACFDMPIAALWLMVVYAYHKSLDERALGWAIVCALLYGLALDTKHNAWLLPPALLAHATLLALPGVVRGFRQRGARQAAPGGGKRSLWARRPRVPLAIVLMLLCGPLLLWGLWPWIWHDTFARLADYVRFHRQHVYYNMEYLGTTYFRPPFPRSYAWLMTFATVPAITLLLGMIGAGSALLACWRGRGRREPAGHDAAPSDSQPAGGDAAAPTRSLLWQPRAVQSWALLWALCIVLSYVPWSYLPLVFPDTPIFGGTKHWLSAYPFLALFAGQGFGWLLERWSRRAPGASRGTRSLVALGFGAATLLGPLAMTWHSHPWGLTAYTPLVGGAPGAATLGLNRSFWGYTTGSVLGYLNQNVGRGERVFLHDTAYDSFRMLQTDGQLRGDIKPWTTVAGSRFALYHHEQHMSRVEHMIWTDYGTTAPAELAAFDGVPMVWVYARPSKPAKGPDAAAAPAPDAEPPASTAPSSPETSEPAEPEPGDPERGAPPGAAGAPR